MIYDPFHWHWIVGGDKSRFWSSKAGAYVKALPKDAGVTRIASEDELNDVLAAYGLPGPVVRLGDYKAAIVAHLDAVAVSRLYDNAVSISTYVNSTKPKWVAEATAFVAWRDEVWECAYAVEAEVILGQREQPTVAEFLAELPKMDWPG